MGALKQLVDTVEIGTELTNGNLKWKVEIDLADRRWLHCTNSGCYLNIPFALLDVVTIPDLEVVQKIAPVLKGRVLFKCREDSDTYHVTDSTYTAREFKNRMSPHIFIRILTEVPELAATTVNE